MQNRSIGSNGYGVQNCSWDSLFQKASGVGVEIKMLYWVGHDFIKSRGNSSDCFLIQDKFFC